MNNKICRLDILCYSINLLLQNYRFQGVTSGVVNAARGHNDLSFASLYLKIYIKDR